MQLAIPLLRFTAILTITRSELVRLNKTKKVARSILKNLTLAIFSMYALWNFQPQLKHFFPYSSQECKKITIKNLFFPKKLVLSSKKRKWMKILLRIMHDKHSSDGFSFLKKNFQQYQLNFNICFACLIAICVPVIPFLLLHNLFFSRTTS